jgi:ribonuclease J
MAHLGDEGVTLLLSDSTNALVPGFSNSESVVDDALNDLIGRHIGRVIIATFASNIYRIKHICETCKKYNRKIVVFGRSMENGIELALNNGLIDDKSLFVDANQANNLKRNEVCILCTGTQGEPLAALSRIANGTHKQISLLNDDLVIFSSSPIPGNAESINRVINKLYLKGVRVFTNTEFSDIHTSGHAKMEELKWMLRIIKPKYFMPMHGEFRMLKQHANIAKLCGIPEENTFICSNGDVIELLNGNVKKAGTVQAGDVYVDGSRIGDIGSVVIKDRKLMSQDGILIAILNINTLTRKLLIKPNVTARGFVLVNENQELMQKIEEKITDSINEYLNKNTPYNLIDLKNQIILELMPYIDSLTGRHPIILPVIMEVKN